MFIKKMKGEMNENIKTHSAMVQDIKVGAALARALLKNGLLRAETLQQWSERPKKRR